MGAAWRPLRGALRERFGAAKIAVYTAITRNYDALSPPNVKVPGWDYLCFTDEPSTARLGWQVRALPASDLDPIRRSRQPKILAHRFLSEYDLSIWVDGNSNIHGDLSELCRLALARADVGFFRHGDHRPSVAAEIEACVLWGKAPRDVMARQYERYRAEGFPDQTGIIPEASIIVRRHHRPQVRAAMEQWWAELVRHSARDQIGLPYVLWRSQVRVELLDWDWRASPWFTARRHNDAPAST